MVLLFIDNSSKTLKILLHYENIFCEYHIFSGSSKSNLILSDIDQLLKSNNLKVSQITDIAYINSGSSFTGLRVALSVLLPIAYINNARIFSINPYVTLLMLLQKSRQNAINEYTIVLIINDFQSRGSWALIKSDNNDHSVLLTENINFSEHSNIDIPPHFNIYKSNIQVIHNIRTKLNPTELSICYNQKPGDFTPIYIQTPTLTDISSLITGGAIPEEDIISADLAYII